ncbi:uncharacterized protein VTP21DRAFT_8349 [Calcarisporiella thermophila]|uniref:uncharacterized protein n=1 Tax=Calcarisporiella thermophila TaxID=911321 RepID=UPI003743C063
MADSTVHKKKVAIVGGGLVGALTALYFGKYGWEVHVYERRKDIRLPENKERGRSINLALSQRGISALRGVGLGLEGIVLASAIPMHGRMIHIGAEGKRMPQAYGVHGEYINSVDRAKLNELLLDSAEQMENVQLHFEHTLKRCDFDAGKAEFEIGDTGERLAVNADLIIGADGAYSSVRNQLMRVIRMNYQQEYIEHGYCELTIPPRHNEKGEPEYAMEPNFLHIWPRHSFMLIALPNPDKSFTCTLFMPFKNFDGIQTREDLLNFFRKHFNDSIALIGEERLVEEYFRNPRGSLMCVKCSPYHYSDKALIIGDAAHSMVPFYGQGMNCGFEDVELLFSLFDQFRVSPTHLATSSETQENKKDPTLERTLAAYTKMRHKDALAICDLAMYNYIEMRSSVVSPLYLMRKRVEAWLHLLMPRYVIPLYTMVSFTSIRYSEAVRRWETQTYWLAAGATGLATGVVGALGWIGWRMRGVLGEQSRKLIDRIL